MTTHPIPLDTPTSWSLQQNLLFQKVFRSVCDSQGLILPPSIGPVSPAQWREIADQVARLAADAFEEVPDLTLPARANGIWNGVERRRR